MANRVLAGPPGSYDSFSAPSALPDMAVAAGQLFAGLRDPIIPTLDALVISTFNGSEWRVSSAHGFGREGNLSVTAFGSRDALLYAGTFNPISGFEVWRRNPPLIEIDAPLRRDLSSARSELVDMIPCLLFPGCLPDPSGFESIMLSIDLTVEKAGSPTDDPELLKQVQAGMDLSIEQLDLGLQKTAQAEKEPSDKVARGIALEAASHFETSLQLARKVQELVASSSNAGNGDDDPIDPPVDGF